MQITDFITNQQSISTPKTTSTLIEVITASIIFVLPLIAMFIIAAK